LSLFIQDKDQIELPLSSRPLQAGKVSLAKVIKAFGVRHTGLYPFAYLMPDDRAAELAHALAGIVTLIT
jgi:hypothetical protein